MKLEKKKMLAARTLGVGKDRIIFNVHRVAEIKEAITKQDLRDLFASGAILIKEIKGAKKITKRRTRRKDGSIRKKVKNGKRRYIILTRKFRKHIAELKKREKISLEDYRIARKEIRAGIFKSREHLKEILSSRGIK